MWKALIPLMLAAQAIAGAPPAIQPAESTTQWAVVEALREICTGLEDRKANGEAITPLFVEQLYQAQQRLAEATLALCKTDEERHAVVENYVAEAKRPLFICGGCIAVPGIPAFSQYLQTQYYMAWAQGWGSRVNRNIAANGRKPKAAIQAGITPLEVAAKARAVYEGLVRLKQGGNPLSPQFVELLHTYSLRWAGALCEGAATE